MDFESPPTSSPAGSSPATGPTRSPAPGKPRLVTRIRGTPSNSSASSSGMPRPGTRQCPTCGELFPGDFRVCPRDAVELVEVEDADDPLLGAVLNDSYQIVRQIGEGGMGRVYEARHCRLTGRSFAIKVMHEFHARQRDIVERFRREAETTCAIGHENVVQVYDVDSTPTGIPYIVSEFLEGEDLGQLLDRLGTFDEATAARIIRQVCRALQAAHDHGVVHRDMKPENVYIVGGPEAPVVKLLDFGIARVEDPAKAMHTRTGVIMGTPAFMAPEQGQGSRVDHRADIYSVGAILYRMLTGSCAHEKEDPAQTLSALLTEEPVRPCELAPRLSPAFELVIQRAMARDPTDRYASMAELEAELAAFDTSEDEAPESTDAASTTGPAMLLRAADASLPPRASRSLVARASRQSKTARPWIVASLALIVLWTYGVLTQSLVQSVELAMDEPLGSKELLIVAVSVAVAMITPVVLWIRLIARTVWRNSVQSMTLARRLRNFATAALSTLGLGLLTLALVRRFAALDTLPTTELTLSITSLLAGLLAYHLTPKEA